MIDEKRVKAFYDFMIDRELIRQRRSMGRPMEEWTADPIFKTYSFTNVKRDNDRTTTRFRKIYEENFSVGNEFGMEENCTLLLNCALFRFFGTEHSAKMIGWVADWTDDTRARIFNLGAQGDLSFTSAYIVTSAGRSDAKFVVVLEFVDSIVMKLEDIVLAVNRDSSWQKAVEIMKTCYGIGSFMAKEIILDYLMVTRVRPNDWQTWTPVGPGGKRGASRVKYGVNMRISEDEALETIRDVYAMRDKFWPDRVVPMRRDRDGVHDMPQLDLTDIQFQMCEFDKYSRVAEGRRPKRLFRPTVDAVTQVRCCEYDHDGDGNCHIHSAPGVLRIAGK